MKFEIPDKILSITIEATRDYQLRLEAEAAALAGLPGERAKRLAQERLEQAEAVRSVCDYFISL